MVTLIKNLYTYIFFFKPFLPPFDRPLFLPTAMTEKLINQMNPNNPNTCLTISDEIEMEKRSMIPTWFEKERYLYSMANRKIADEPRAHAQYNLIQRDRKCFEVIEIKLTRGSHTNSGKIRHFEYKYYR